MVVGFVSYQRSDVAVNHIHWLICLTAVMKNSQDDVMANHAGICSNVRCILPEAAASAVSGLRLPAIEHGCYFLPQGEDSELKFEIRECNGGLPYGDLLPSGIQEYGRAPPTHQRDWLGIIMRKWQALLDANVWRRIS